MECIRKPLLDGNSGIQLGKCLKINSFLRYGIILYGFACAPWVFSSTSWSSFLHGKYHVFKSLLFSVQDFDLVPTAFNVIASCFIS